MPNTTSISARRTGGRTTPMAVGTWLDRRVGVTVTVRKWVVRQRAGRETRPAYRGEQCLERETGFEPATSTLARSHSTTELFPPEPSKYHTAGAGFKPSARSAFRHR